MMLGTIAQGSRDGVVGGGALAYADFVAGQYSVGGVAVTAADIIDNPSRIGASGLFIDSSQTDGTVTILGGFLSALLTLNWTLVLEVEMLDSLHETRLFGMSETDGDFLQIVRRDSFNSLAILTQDVAFTFRENLDTAGYGTGIHRIAVTRTNSLLATSTDGNAAVSDGSTLSLTLEDAAFGDYAGSTNATNDFYVRSAVLIAPVAASSLPALSA